MSRPRVLVLRPGALGDACMAMPIVAGLARQAEVSWLARSAYAPIVRQFPSVKTQIVPFDFRLSPTRVSPEQELIDRLQQQRFDALLDLCHWPETSCLVRHLDAVPIRATGHDPDQDTRLRIRLPSTELYSPFNVQVTVSHLAHQLDKWREVVRTALRLDVDDWQLPPALEPRDGPLRIFLQPHAGSPCKVWPHRRFAEALAWLARRRPIEVFVNSGNRQEWARTLTLVARLVLGGVSVRVVVKDRSYRRLTDVLRRCHLALGNDSGPMHLASLLGVPTIVLFGPYAPEEFGPRWRSTAICARGKATAAVGAEEVITVLAPWARGGCRAA